MTETPCEKIFLEAFHHFTMHDRPVLAYSGGAESNLLLELLAAFKDKLTVLWVNPSRRAFSRTFWRAAEALPGWSSSTSASISASRFTSAVAGRSSIERTFPPYRWLWPRSMRRRNALSGVAWPRSMLSSARWAMHIENKALARAASPRARWQAWLSRFPSHSARAA